MNMKEDTILKVLPWDVRSIIQKEKLEFEYLQEIRLREGKPLIFLYHDTEVIPGKWEGKEPEIHFFGKYPCGT